MDWIVEGLALGGWGDTRIHLGLQGTGIEAVLQLYGPEARSELGPLAKEVLQLNVLDARPLPPSLLRQGVEFIRSQREQGRPTLAACGAGLSRSPSFLAAYLYEVGRGEGMDLQGAFATILQGRRGIIPHPELLRSLVRYYGLEMTAEELLVALVREKKRLRESAWTG